MKRRFTKYQFRRTTLTFWFCVMFLVGIGFAHGGKSIGAIWPVLAIPPLLFALHRHSYWTFLWIVLFGVSLGWWRGSVYIQKLAEWQQNYDQKVTITAVASQDAAYNKYKQLVFDAKQVRLEDEQILTGKISMSGFGLNAIF